LESDDIDAEPDTEPEGAVDGEDGVLVEPAEDELEPDGEVVVPREAARLPRATEIARAIGVSLM
jgi:hypothetical protein